MSIKRVQDKIVNLSSEEEIDDETTHNNILLRTLLRGYKK